ncbi:hypothetical protein ACC687_39360, partial [Rhizobium ruizarguesonis]
IENDNFANGPGIADMVIASGADVVNILFGRPDAGEEGLVEAARRAEAIEFIERLQDQQGRRGFDAHVGERGVKLSGGQRQRIAIARV